MYSDMEMWPSSIALALVWCHDKRRRAVTPLYGRKAAQRKPKHYTGYQSIEGPLHKGKSKFFSSDASRLYEKNTWVTKPSCQAVAGIPSLHAPEKWEIAELYHSPWCAALHSQFLFMDYIFILKKGYMSITVYSALHWDITEHYQWGYNRSLSWNRKIQQFDLADGCVIRSQYPECY